MEHIFQFKLFIFFPGKEMTFQLTYFVKWVELKKEIKLD